MEEREDPLKTDVNNNSQSLSLLSSDPEGLLDGQEGEGVVDVDILLDSPQCRLADSVQSELAALTVSLPSDITNGTLEDVHHNSPGAVGRKNPT